MKIVIFHCMVSVKDGVNLGGEIYRILHGIAAYAKTRLPLRRSHHRCEIAIHLTIDIVTSAFGSAGQRCSALRVLCLQTDSADRVNTAAAGEERESDDYQLTA